MRITMKWLLGVPLLLGVATAARANRDPEPACVVAARWVKEHPSAMPSSLTEISRYPLAIRKAMFAKLSRRIQLKLWHEQFAYYLQSEQLSERQKTFLAALDGEVDQYFGPENAAAAKTRYDAKVREVFGVSLGRAVFANLGVATPDEVSPGRTLPPSCDCSTASDWCVITGPECRKAFLNCTNDTGCGFLWCYDCDGICP